MNVLSVAELKAQVETDIDNATLQQIIDAAERDIEKYIGPPTAAVYETSPEMQTEIRLPIPAASVTSIVEYSEAESDPTTTTLASNDYALSTNKLWIRRLSDGTNPRDVWGWHVVVTYTPETDDARRQQVAIQLCRLELDGSVFERESIGDWTGWRVDTERKRSRILSRLDQVKIT